MTQLTLTQNPRLCDVPIGTAYTTRHGSTWTKCGRSTPVEIVEVADGIRKVRECEPPSDRYVTPIIHEGGTQMAYRHYATQRIEVQR